MPGPMVPAVTGNDEDDEQQQSTSPFAQRPAPVDNSGAAPQQPVQTQPAQTQPAQAAPASASVPAPPVAPTIDQQRYQQIEQRLEQDRKPIDRNDPSVKPRWYDRLAGGLIGFGAGYKGGAAEGVAVGSAVTNRRYDQAEAQREARLKADEGAMSDFQNQAQMARQNFEAQSQAYENNLNNQRLQAEQQQYQFDRNFRTSEARRNQQNADRTYDREVKNDQYTHNKDERDYKQRQNDEDRRYRLESQRVGIEGQREKREEANDRSAASAATQLRGDMAANNLDQKRQESYDDLENGNDKKGIVGYRQQLRELQDPNAINPQTNKKYTPEERQAAIQQLNADHNEAKQRIEDTYAAQMQQIGKPVQRVVYGPDGQPMQQQPQQAPPQQQQPQSMVTQKTKTQVHIGQPVNVGGRLARVTGFKNGKPVISYINQGQ